MWISVFLFRLVRSDDFNLKLEDLSVLRVYFGEPTALYYKRVISNTWVEAFSKCLVLSLSNII